MTDDEANREKLREEIRSELAAQEAQRKQAKADVERSPLDVLKAAYAENGEAA